MSKMPLIKYTFQVCLETVTSCVEQTNSYYNFIYTFNWSKSWIVLYCLILPCFLFNHSLWKLFKYMNNNATDTSQHRRIWPYGVVFQSKNKLPLKKDQLCKLSTYVTCVTPSLYGEHKRAEPWYQCKWPPLLGGVSVTVRHDPTGGTTGTLKSFFRAELRYSSYSADMKGHGFTFVCTLLLQL